MAVKGFPGKGGSKMPYKVASYGRSGIRTTNSRGGAMAGLPPKAVNPFKTARMTVNRTTGLAKMPGKGIY